MQTLARKDKKDSHNRDCIQPNMSLLAYGLTLLFNEVDQPIGRRIMRGHWAAAIKLRLNFLSQLLSQLHSPLIKAVDVPDDALNEDLVLIHGDQGSKNEWCKLGEHNRIAWTISFKDLQKIPRNVPQLVVTPKSSERKHTVPQGLEYVGL